MFLALTAFVVSAGLLAACGEKPAHVDHAGPAHWGYEGPEGPDKWGTLEGDWAACATGRKQSPIDIAGPTEGDVPDVGIDYKPTRVNILNNGHTIQVNCDEGSSITVELKVFKLLQFHFHTPSEHTVAGNPYDLEVHFVHKSDEGKLAVVGALIERGGPNEALGAVWQHLPPAQADVKTIAGAMVDPAAVLPTDRSYYNYAGSLTTPPCTEGVHWFVLTTPVTMSGEQIATFQKIFRGNARPVQPLNDRTVVEGD